MKMLLYRAARKHAREIRASYNINPHSIDDLVTIANMLGADVSLRALDPDISGVVIKEQYESPKIYINSDENIFRQRFTLAHEIGHLVDRTKLIDDDKEYSFIDYRKPGEYDLHEFFADEFAGELLMPGDQFMEVLNKIGEFGTSERFGVSVPAVRARKKRLEKHPHQPVA